MMNNREGHRAFITQTMSGGCKVDIEGGGGSQLKKQCIHVKCSTLIETPDICVVETANLDWQETHLKA